MSGLQWLVSLPIVSILAACSYEADVKCEGPDRHTRGTQKTFVDDANTLTASGKKSSCRQQQNQKAPRLQSERSRMQSEYVDFVLSRDVGLGPGITAPPPQRLRIPLRLLDPSGSSTQRAAGAINAGSVTLNVPFVDGFVVLSAPPDAPSVAMSVTVSAAGWQARARMYNDPESGGMTNYKKDAPLESGLRPVVPIDPLRIDTTERLYVVEDEQLGFVTVKCFGPPELGPRRCRVTSELSSYLVLNIYLREDELSSWRAVTVAARPLVSSFVF